MEKIALLDTAVGSTNKGDEIIMECVKEELGDLLNKYFVMNTPTHLSAFTLLQNIGRLPDSAREISEAKYKFVCGTNLFSRDMIHRCNQWNIGYFNSRPVTGSIFVGVGSNGRNKINFYTRKLYKKILSKEFIHSVREEKAEKLLKEMGFKCINTGCVTLWKLTPDFCKDIKRKKSESVVFTLTDYNKDTEKDKQMIEILRKSYTNIDDINIVSPSIESYKKVLKKDIDYVGTRLHAGIYAMRHRKRAIILSVDERMNSMKWSIKENCISRNDIDELKQFIDSEIETKVNLDFELIKKWKEQFK